MADRILDGVTVVDTSQWVTGGFATLMLANQGARVIKIERPKYGDDIRQSGPPFIEGEAPYFWTVNYGKESIEIDLKTDEGKKLVYDLVKDADVFVENFRPGKINDLGLGYDELSSINNEIIYCSISAFGETGPLSQRSGLDLLIQGMSGVMDVTGEQEGEPVKVGVAITDLVTAMWSGFAIINALYKRDQTGQGEYIDIGMLDSMIPWLTKQAGKAFAGDKPKRMGSRDPLIAPYQAFEAEDGYINIAAGNQNSWEKLCVAIDRKDLLEDDRFASNPDRVEHMDELEAELEKTFRKRPVDEWVEILVEEHSISAGPINSVNGAIENEQIEHRDVISSLEHRTAGEQPVIDHPTNYRFADHGFTDHAPVLGEHSREVLLSMGYDSEVIETLFEEEVVFETGLN